MHPKGCPRIHSGEDVTGLKLGQPGAPFIPPLKGWAFPAATRKQTSWGLSPPSETKRAGNQGFIRESILSRTKRGGRGDKIWPLEGPGGAGVPWPPIAIAPGRSGKAPA